MNEPAPSKPAALGTEAANVAGLVSYQAGSVVSREIIRKPTGTVTVFAFDEGEGLSEHTAPFDGLVHVLEGEAEIRIAGHPHVLRGGDVILLPAHQRHALHVEQ